MVIQMIDKSKIFEGNKFMWDGRTYVNEGEAKSTEEKYRKNGFETKIIKEENQYLIYTRREIKEIVLEGPAPP